VRHRLRSAICIAVVALAGIVAAGSGCSNQGEGERCEFFPGEPGSINGSTPTNGSQDCQDGLVCMSPVNPEAVGNYDVCCPMDLSTATAEACKSGNVPGGNPTAGRDAAFVDSATDAKDDADKSDATKKKDADEKDADDKDATEKRDAEKDGTADSSLE
jgi:hypothetical protein